MKILITGANGFVGKNLCYHLKQRGNIELLCYDKKSTFSELDQYTKECDFVYHLAGVNRPKNVSEFMEGNFGFTSTLLNLLKKNNNKCPIVLSSSIQAELDNDYGKSKKAGEDLLINYGKNSGVNIYIFRFPNLFGKWCKPNYNSVIATWCYNIANNIDITISDFDKELTLGYIDDVCEELIKCLDNKQTEVNGYCILPITYKKKLGMISELLKSFKLNYRDIMVPSTGDEFTKKLYSTYISYVPFDDLVIDLVEHKDNRGIFCECIRTEKSGQISLSTTNPGIIRGGHYHNTKIERFIVVKGKAKIEFENIYNHQKYEFFVSEDKLQYVTIPVGYQHSINNIGDDELVLLIWANELFNAEKSDTYVMEEENGITRLL